MNAAFSVINIAAPLMIVTMGALVSEYAGRMAMFLEYMINLGAFLCYALALATGNIVLASALSVISCSLLVLCLEKIASQLKANMFLVSLAMNMLFGAGVSLLSSITFGTRGVLYSPTFKMNPVTARSMTSIACYVLTIIQMSFLMLTKNGLILRITGSDEKMLEAQGIRTSFYKSLAWVIAAADGAFCGCVLTMRLSSFVPGISSGKGWTALAAVFLARKKTAAIIPAVLVFAVAEWLSTGIQNYTAFRSVPSPILLALPYLLSLAMIAVLPGKDEQ
ncbi:MAG: ABC transporter permease [Treponema sp.]|nr:ABC transporter permease [Treponema sp.]